MKKTILALAVAAFLIVVAVSSCSTPAEKVEKAEKEVIDANNNLDSAIKNYQADMDLYRVETAAMIAANEKSIADFNARIANEKREAKAKYKTKIAELEKKNTDMKKRLDDYKADGNGKWIIFKAEFTKEMNDLGRSIKDLTTKKEN